MSKLSVGGRVRGKTKRLSGKVGVIKVIRTDSRQRKYDVLWSNGEVETVAARAIELDVSSSTGHAADNTSQTISDPAYTTFTELLTSSSASCIGELESSSSSEDDEDDALGSDTDEEDEDARVIAHNRVWIPCSSVLLDQGSQVQPRPTPFLMGVLHTRTFADYFYLMYPMQTIKDTLAFTNTNLAQQQKRIKDGDWFSWLGIRLAMAVEPRSGPLRTYWDTESREGFIDTPANFGQRFGMTRHCFEEIMSCMAFSDGSNGNDPWKPIRPVVDGFNARRLRVVFPGDILCVDECMSAWKGREAKFCHDGLPHKTKIARKPDGKSTELKSIADGESGVLLGLELVEGATRQRSKQYAREYGEGTAVVLRLAEPFQGTGRTIVADSAFASVKTLVQLEQRLSCILWGW